MQISGIVPHSQTILFICFLTATILFTLRKDRNPHSLNPSHTDELKGVAILMVLFSHIGYFLFSDHTFLYPLTVAGGVGVNTFLFLSGYGLTRSEIKSRKGVFHFYAKRLRNIFIPMWLVLIPTLLLDAFIIGKTYSPSTIVHSFVGFFPNGDIDSAINSPLWYFSLIFFYYLVFPLVYWKKGFIFSIGAVFALGYYVAQQQLPVTKDVLKLYQMHYVAFPLGMAFAYLYTDRAREALRKLNSRLLPIPLVASGVRYLLIAFFCLLFGYTAIHSGIGETLSLEQKTSLVTMGCVILIILLKNVQSRFLILLGTYSYEIYLIQWPILYRYDFIYGYTSPFLGTVLYFGVFIGIGYVLHRITKSITKTSQATHLRKDELKRTT